MLVAYEKNLPTSSRVPDGLGMYFCDEWTSGIYRGQAPFVGSLTYSRADPMCTEDDDRPFGDILNLLDEGHSTVNEPVDDVLVVHDLVEDVDRLPFEDVKKLVHDIDRHVDASAKTTWIGHDQSQINLQEAHSSNRQSLKPPRYTFRSMQAPASIPVIELLESWGPDQRPAITIDEANRYCRELALSHGENFSVLTRYVPNRMLEGVCAVYAFCRWADDLGDETGDPKESLRLLSWWREELERCFEGSPSHPVFMALAPVVERHGLSVAPFEALINAFEQDQTKTRYGTWDEVLGYCRGSADPVGRLFLALAGEPCSVDQLAASDAVCTALQLTNHWQDVLRDLVDRDRIYLPSELHSIPDFESRLRSTMDMRHAPDATFLESYRELIRTCVERTWDLFQEGNTLLEMVDRDIRPVIWLFQAGGTTVLRRIEQWNFETCLGRPRIGAMTKMYLAIKASRQGRRVS